MSAQGALKAQGRPRWRTTLIWIGVVLRAARTVKELPVRPEIVQETRDACAELRLTGKARKRTRRPTPEELQRLRDYFAHRDGRSKIPMQSVMDFALSSARRESEICRLEWRDMRYFCELRCWSCNVRGIETGAINCLPRPVQR